MNLSKSVFLPLSLILMTILGVSMNFSHAKGDSKERVDKPFIYKITHPEISEPSYLFGSFHYGVSTSELPLWVTQLHSNTRTHLYENDIQAEKKFDYYRSLFHQNPPSTSNQPTKISQPTIERLIKMGVPKSFAPHIDLSDCEFSFTLLKFAHYEQWQSLDYEFMIETKQSGKLFVELETDEFRDNYLKLYPPSVGSSCNFDIFLSLPEFAKGWVNSFHKKWDQVMVKYRSGDDNHFGTGGRKGTIHRNQHWMKTLVPAIINGSTFTVVGVDHLSGPSGLISLLQDQGFQVERLVK